MKIAQNYPLPKTVDEAIAIQENLRSEIITTDQLGTVQYVAGVDVGFAENDNLSVAGVAVLSFPDLELKEKAIAKRTTTFPYLPGFLSFREVPAVLDALAQLTIAPDLILCDGQGIAHPRRFGLACHLGLLANVPTIGVAKSIYIGEHEEVGAERGSWQALWDNGEVIGAVLRSQTNVKPLYVSSGHCISLPTAIDYVLRCAPKYRLPETTRWADKLASGIGNG